MFLGIDPGKSGAVALINGGDVHCVTFAKTSPADLIAWLDCENYDEQNRHFANIDFCVIEKVSASPQMGVTSAFTFGQWYGLAEGILVSLGIPFERVTPQKWQKEFGLIQRGKKLGDTEKKRQNKARCQELFPGVKITNANADAILIAEYCRRVKG